MCRSAWGGGGHRCESPSQLTGVGGAGKAVGDAVDPAGRPWRAARLGESVVPVDEDGRRAGEAVALSLGLIGDHACREPGPAQPDLVERPPQWSVTV